MRHRGTAIATFALLAFTLVSCSGISDGDRTACETFANAHNALMRSLDGSKWDMARSMGAAVPGDIQNAILVADDPELRIALDDLSEYATEGLVNSNEDAGVAYFLQAGNVFETCNDLGADVEKYETVDPTQ